MIGGFDGTSNVIAGKLLPGVNVKGTHAHAFVQAFSRLSEVIPMSEESGLKTLLERVLRYRTELDFQETHDGELAAFVSYAHAFPDGFLALIDTYDSLSSGCRNFILVALALDDLGFTPRGIRLDSGDLAYISKCCRDLFTTYGEKMKRSFFSSCAIVASNDINESVLVALSKAEHCITSFGIGTNLVTCQKQPALGCVYKLCEINGQPRIKVRAARELAAAGEDELRHFQVHAKTVQDAGEGESDTQREGVRGQESATPAQPRAAQQGGSGRERVRSHLAHYAHTAPPLVHAVAPFSHTYGLRSCRRTSPRC